MFICPVCKEKLNIENNAYRCINCHSFDISRKGYVNLLISNKSSKRHHGDDKAMSVSRRDFLNRGYYKPLADAICREISNPKSIFDAGCGECYYSEQIRRSFGKIPEIYGIDISKEILAVAASRARQNNIKLAVASCSRIPLDDNSTDHIISVFAPVFENEFSRVLSKGGKLVRVTAGKDHLIELKRTVYDKPQYNDELDLLIDGFNVSKQTELKYIFTLKNNTDVKNLFAMTPYYYKTSEADKAKIDVIDSLDVTAHFILTIYDKCY